MPPFLSALEQAEISRQFTARCALREDIDFGRKFPGAPAYQLQDVAHQTAVTFTGIFTLTDQACIINVEYDTVTAEYDIGILCIRKQAAKDTSLG